ncbi:hypothetical protein ACH3O9_13495 [Leeuwenhoekiella sp. A16]|tara:strand:- start:177 stop:323 length:147 start_codon:yes stop_codon:yes gene_type:complete
MAHIYSEKQSQKCDEMKPKKETIDFLLNYSKALSVMDYKYGKFEALLN